jgi:gliding motility-associated-like protein
LILISDADAETQIEWQDGSDDVTYVVSAAGIYILYEVNHCGSASDSIVVTYESAPLPFELGEDVVLCPGESIMLNAPVTTDLITWQDGSHETSFIAEQEQVYSLQLSNDCGITSDEVSVSFDDDIPELSLDPTISLCGDEVIVLDATQPFVATYSWSTGSILPSIQISTPGDYSVSVLTNCYTVDDAVQVLADADCDNVLFIPNVFSPNGDNINDEWVIVPNDPDIISIECRVFDRWGDLVFTATEIPIVWNGQFNSKELNPGVYVYLVILTKQDGESDVRFGDITLVR